MAEREATDSNKKETTFDKCDPERAAGGETGPVREAGGTTGANNLSPGGANRTRGATSGVSPDDPMHRRSRDIPPNA
jgi:hypothetical protein